MAERQPAWDKYDAAILLEGLLPLLKANSHARMQSRQHLVTDVGERADSGIPNIFRVWREQGWAMPTITEQLEPERTLLTLTFKKIGDKHKDERNYHCGSYGSC